MSVRLGRIGLWVAGAAVVVACGSSGGGGTGSTQDDGGPDGSSSGTSSSGASSSASSSGASSSGASSSGASDGSSEATDATDGAPGDSSAEAATDGGSNGGDGGASDGGPKDAAVDGPSEAGICLGTDVDGDGYCPPVDCDDNNPFVNPGMMELADDGIDNDCSGGDLTAAAGPGVYVDMNDGACSDTDATRGSKAKPYCTLAKAVADTASSSGSHNVFVAKGSYPLAISVNASMSLFGGYDPAAWTYDPAANVTTVGGQDTIQFTGGTPAPAWLTLNGTTAVQGLHVSGGLVAPDAGHANFFSVDIASGSTVVLAHDSISGGSAYGTIAVEVRSAATALLFENTVVGGTPSGAGAFAVNNLGGAKLFGNRIDLSAGGGTAVQNYGTMLLAANVINGTSPASNSAQTVGLANLNSGSTTSKAYAAGNDIFGGRGLTSSYGIESSGETILVDNVIGGRAPTSTAGATGDNVGFFAFGTGTAELANNAFFTPLTSGTAHDVYATVTNSVDAGVFTYFSSAASVDGCTFSACIVAQGTQNVDPAFTAPASGDFHIPSTSPCKSAGTEALPWLLPASGMADRDFDLQARPLGTWDIGADEIP